MKKLIIILALLPVLFLGCSKSSPDKPEPEEQKFKVQFTANVINVEVSPISKKYSSTKTSSNNFDQLSTEGIGMVDYYLYDKNDNLIGYQSLGLFDMGNVQSRALQFETELPKGEYTIGVIARSGNSPFIKGDKKESHFISFPIQKLDQREIIQFYPVYIHKYSSFKVEDQEVNNQIQLKRLNAQVELNIQDEIPSNVKYLLLGGNLSPYTYLFNPHMFNPSGGKGFIKFDLDLIRNTDNKILLSPFYPEYFSTSESNNIKNYDVVLYDKDFKYLGTKTIKDVYFKENHITKLTGNFFDTLESSNNSTAIKIDFVQEYSTDKIDIKF